MVDLNYKGPTKILELSTQNAKLIYVSLQKQIASSISIHIDVPVSLGNLLIDNQLWFEQLILLFCCF